MPYNFKAPIDINKFTFLAKFEGSTFFVSIFSDRFFLFFEILIITLKSAELLILYIYFLYIFEIFIKY